MVKLFFALAFSAFAVLSAVAVWLGGLNQDEGWYLYAAQLVAQGELPYRDFFYTQGPLMPLVYSAFAWTWRTWGLLGARVLTLTFGAAGILFAAGLARRLVPEGRRGIAALLVLLLLGNNLYHLYFCAIPKTYALAGLFVLAGFYLLTFARAYAVFFAGVSLAFAAGARLSLGALLAVAGLFLLLRGPRRAWLWFALGGALALVLVYGPFLFDPMAREGLLAAQGYHASRGGFDPLFAVGSVSRLVRWYFPVFVILALGLFAGRGSASPSALCRWSLPLAGFLVVFCVQMLAPFPYEDYQVPIMALLAVAAVAVLLNARSPLPEAQPLLTVLVVGMVWTGSFGSPLLEKWMTNGQDRFWPRKKSVCEMAQLRTVAREIEALDPGGKELLTQDLYLAIETRRSVPRQLAMGPFSYWGAKLPYPGAERVMVDDAGMERLLTEASCPVAAMSGYAFAIEAPACAETPIDRQLAFWRLLRERYDLAFREEAFGQNATPLLVLKRKPPQSGK